MGDKITIFYANIGLDYWSNRFKSFHQYLHDKNNIFDIIEGSLDKEASYNHTPHKRPPSLQPLPEIKFDEPYQVNYQCYRDNEFYQNYYAGLIKHLDREVLKYTDLVILSEFCTSMLPELPIKSFYSQSYGIPSFAIKQHIPMNSADTKNMLIGALDSNITVEPIDKLNVRKFRNQWDYFYNKIQYDPKHYYGCIQVATILKKYCKELIIANVHTRFTNKDNFINSFKKLFEIISGYHNVIIIGDFNIKIIGNHNYFLLAGKDINNVDIVVPETVITDNIKKYGFTEKDLNKLYSENEECHRPYKWHHLKIYYKLADFTICPPEPIDCEFNLYTSSHISYKFAIQPKQQNLIVQPKPQAQNNKENLNPRKRPPEQVNQNYDQTSQKMQIEPAPAPAPTQAPPLEPGEIPPPPPKKPTLGTGGNPNKKYILAPQSKT